MIQKILLVFLFATTLVLLSCGGKVQPDNSSLLSFVSKTLQKAKENKADSLPEYQVAKANYEQAIDLDKQMKKEEAKRKALDSLENARLAIIIAKENEVKNKITTLQKEIKDSKSWNLKQVKFEGNIDVDKEASMKLEFVKKIKPIEKAIAEADSLFFEASQLVSSIKKEIRKEEEIADLEKYIGLTQQASQKLDNANKEFTTIFEEFKKEIMAAASAVSSKKK